MEIPLMRANPWKHVRIAAVGVVFGWVLLGGSTRGWSQIAPPTMGGSGAGMQGPDYGQGPPTAGKSRKTAAQPGDMSVEPINTKMEEQQAKLRNNDRQKRLQTDSARLLALATELKEQVDKTNKDDLSVEMIKKADEIEKLAKSVKDRMKG